jgi:hypothetical protein
MRRLVGRIARGAKAAVVVVWALVAGALGADAPVLGDRKAMYGDDPANNPHSPEYDPNAGRKRRPD